MKLLRKTNHVVATRDPHAQHSMMPPAPLTAKVDMTALRRKKLQSLVNDSFDSDVKTPNSRIERAPALVRILSTDSSHRLPALRLRRATSVPLDEAPPETLKRAANIWKRKSSTYRARQDDGALQRAAKEVRVEKAQIFAPAKLAISCNMQLLRYF